jgi:hypothetical protein
MKNYIIIFFFLILFSACQETFDPKLPPYRAKIAFNDLFEQNQPFSFSVSHSVDIFDTVNEPEYNNNAVVKLFVDGVLKETVPNSGAQGRYDATTVPVPGKNYKVIVSVPGFEDAEAENTLPVPVTIQSWSFKDSDITKIDIDQHETLYGTLKFTIVDPPVDNQYMFSIKFHDQLSGNYIFISTISSDDEVLNGNFAKRLSNGEFLFKDTRFNGKTKTFEVLIPCGLVTQADYLLSFYTLSKDSYLYYYTEPGDASLDAMLYNNVKNGLGIFAGRSLSTDTIK